MKTKILIGALIALLVPAAVFAAPGVMLEAQKGRQLAAVRQATARYHDVNVALADGYVPVSGCEELPGQGAMGVHYLNPALAQDLESDPAKPEVLLYLPKEDGELRLIGVEYFQASAGRTAAQAPAILGVKFDGPMPGHNPQMPEHFDLHVWVWANNPAGMFAAWNPALSCGEAAAPHGH
jgi:hypothetical protein